ncbi:hypothetical protein Droror1_Dr00011709 [Drosera rotundifolia]
MRVCEPYRLRLKALITRYEVVEMRGNGGRFVHGEVRSPEKGEDIGSSTASTPDGQLPEEMNAAASTLSKAPLKSCYFKMPRFTPGHGAIGM